MARRADEQRQHPRIQARLAMQLAEVAPEASLVTTESLNISRGGVYCESAEYLSPLSRVALTVVLPALARGTAPRVLKTDGIVVRSEALAPVRGKKRWQIACCFTSLDGEARELLDAFIAWRASGARARAAAASRPAARPAPRKVAKRAVKKVVKRTAVKKAVRKAVVRKAAAKKGVQKKARRATSRTAKKK